MADEIIRQLQELYGVDTDLGLSVELGLNRSAVAHWRHRGAVPEKFQQLLKAVRDELHQDELVSGELTRRYTAKVAARLYGAADASNWIQVGLALMPPETFTVPTGSVERGRFLEAALLSIIGFAMQAARAEFGSADCKTRGDILRIIEVMRSEKYRDGVHDSALGSHRRQQSQPDQAQSEPARRSPQR